MDYECNPGREIVLGVVADTHIPDRVTDLHPDLVKGLMAEGVELILHAGDVSSEDALSRLSEAAPVRAVQGNRDFIALLDLPPQREITVNGVKIFLAHGHGSFIHYLLDKLVHILRGYDFERYRRHMKRSAGGAGVIVFGHTHRPENRLEEGVLFFNPGSAGPNYERRRPTFGTLRIGADGRVQGRIHSLSDLGVENRRWSSG